MAFVYFHPWVASMGCSLGHVCEPFCVPILGSACAGLSHDFVSLCSGLGSVVVFRDLCRIPLVLVPSYEMFRVGRCGS